MNELVSPMLHRMVHPWVAASVSRPRFGIVNGPRGDWPALLEFVGQLEELGIDSYWATDHPAYFPDCWTTLTAAATASRRLRLGPLVACIYYRGPLLLARVAADVDRLSGGRLVLGLGIGDRDEEFARMGLAFPSTRARQEALEETALILRWLWGEASGPPAGQHFAVSGPPLSPGPVQQPRIPLLIAGGGERVTLRQVAQYADASNFGEHAFTGGVRTDEALLRRLEALRRHCETFERPYETVLRTHTTLPLVLAHTHAGAAEKVERYMPQHGRALARESIVAGTPRDAVAHFSRLIHSGLQYFLAYVYGSDLETVRLLVEQVIPELPDLAPAANT